MPPEQRFNKSPIYFAPRSSTPWAAAAPTLTLHAYTSHEPNAAQLMVLGGACRPELKDNNTQKHIRTLL